MDWLRTALLAVAPLSALLWTPLLGLVSTAALASALVLCVLWAAVRGQAAGMAACTVFLLWALGGWLWLTAPAANPLAALPFGLLIVAALSQARGGRASAMLSGLLAAALIAWLATAWPLPGSATQAGLVVASLVLVVWPLSACEASLRRVRLAAPVALALLAIAGLVQWDLSRASAQAMAVDPDPRSRLDAHRLAEARDWQRRFPQPGAETMLSVRAALLAGPESPEALAVVLRALGEHPVAPSTAAAACLLLGASDGDLLCSRVTAGQVANSAMATGLLSAAQAAARGTGDQPALLAWPVAGRQLGAVRVTEPSGQSPTVLVPGARYRIDTLWRTMHASPRPADVRLRLGTHDSALFRLGPTGEETEVLTSREFQIPATLPPDVTEALLAVVSGPPSHEETFSLGPVQSTRGFRPVDPSEARAGISEENRLRLFGEASEALHVCAALDGTDSALLEIEPARRVRRLALISYLTAAADIAQAAAIGQVLISSQQGSLEAFAIVAGRDTAEVWHDYPPYAGQIGHGRPEVAWQTPRPHPEFEFHNTCYLMRIDLGQAMDVRALRLRTSLPAGTGLSVVDVVLLPE